MPRSKRTHRTVLAETCLLCLRRANRTLSAKLRTLVKDNVFKNYDNHQDILPSGICYTCQEKLEASTKLQQSKPLTPLPRIDFERLVREMGRVFPDNWISDCGCRLCQSAKTPFGKNKPTNFFLLQGKQL